MGHLLMLACFLSTDYGEADLAADFEERFLPAEVTERL